MVLGEDQPEPSPIADQSADNWRLNSLEIRNFRPVVGHITLGIALGRDTWDVEHAAFNYS